MTTEDALKFSEFMNIGALDSAYKLLNENYKINPLDYSVLYHFGLLYRVTGDFENAKFYLKKAIEVNPEDTAARYTLGIIYQLENNYQKSVQYLKKVLELDPMFFLAYNSLGLTFKKNGKFSPAIESYTLAHSTFIKAILIDLKKHPEQVLSLNNDHTASTSDYWYQTIIKNLFHIAESEGIDKIEFPTEESILKLMKTNYNDTDPWKDKDDTRLINFNIFALVYGKLKSDSFYCTVCSNIAMLLIEINDYKNAKKWLLESIEFIPKGFNYQEPYKALNFIKSLE